MCQNLPNPSSMNSNQAGSGQTQGQGGEAGSTEMAWIWQRLCTLYTRVWERFHLQQRMDQIQQIICERPQMAIFSVVLILLCAVPLLGFIAFVLITITVTFFGFIFVEGTLLTLGTLVLCAILLVLSAIGVTIATILVVIYMGMTGGRGAFQEAFVNFSRCLNDAIQQTAMRDYWNQHMSHHWDQHWANQATATTSATTTATSSTTTTQSSSTASTPDDASEMPSAPPEDLSNQQPTLRQRNIYPDISSECH